MLPVLLGKDLNIIRFVCIKLGLTMGLISLVVWGPPAPSIYLSAAPHRYNVNLLSLTSLRDLLEPVPYSKAKVFGSKPKKIVDPPFRQSPARNYAALMEW